jgi:hypothetical protein
MTTSIPPDYGWEPSLEMSLPDKIKQDLRTSLKNKDPVVRDTLRQIMAEFPNLTVPVKVPLEGGGVKNATRPKRPEEITDDEVIGIIQKLVKSEKTVLEARREETSPYLQTLERYLPRMASRQDIEAWIQQNIDFSQFKSPMQAMGPIMQHFGRQADGNQVKQILQEMTR